MSAAERFEWYARAHSGPPTEEGAPHYAHCECAICGPAHRLARELAVDPRDALEPHSVLDHPDYGCGE